MHLLFGSRFQVLAADLAGCIQQMGGGLAGLGSPERPSSAVQVQPEGQKTAQGPMGGIGVALRAQFGVETDQSIVLHMARQAREAVRTRLVEASPCA